jgi:hypothetical protein
VAELPLADFEEAFRAGRSGEAATVARRLFGQFMMGDSKAFKRLSCAAIRRHTHAASFLEWIAI